LWPQNSQTEWNGPRQWKRINDVRRANWNVRLLYGAGAMNELVKEMDKYEIDISAVQEIKWPRKGNVDIKVTNMNLEEDFLLVVKIKDDRLDFETVNERMWKIRVKLQYGTDINTHPK